MQTGRVIWAPEQSRGSIKDGSVHTITLRTGRETSPGWAPMPPRLRVALFFSLVSQQLHLWFLFSTVKAAYMGQVFYFSLAFWRGSLNFTSKHHGFILFPLPLLCRVFNCRFGGCLQTRTLIFTSVQLHSLNGNQWNYTTRVGTVACEAGDP